jgi:hypothetical protein
MAHDEEAARLLELRFAQQRKHAVLIRFTPQLLEACRNAAAKGLPMSMVFGDAASKNVRRVSVRSDGPVLHHRLPY